MIAVKDLYRDLLQFSSKKVNLKIGKITKLTLLQRRHKKYGQ